jgi:MFS family permease
MDSRALAMSETFRRSTPSERWLTRGVVGIGLASLLSDWGHEAATAILPTFLLSLGAPAVALGLIEGVSDGLSSLAKLAGGSIADRPRWPKPVAIVGYLATALTTFAYSFADRWPFLLAMRSLGWIGRGARGPSRDTLLADSVRPDEQGRAFGFERAMDTIGAVLGPLSATALLGVLGARGVLRLTLVPGAAAAVAFACLAPAQGRLQRRAPVSADEPGRKVRFSPLPKSFWHFLAGVFTHGIGDFAPTLFILRASQILTPKMGAARAATVSLALYTFYNLVNAAASYPAGAAADRTNKRGLLAAGYLVSAVTCAGFILTRPTIFVLVILFGLAGIHGAFQQSLEKSAAAELLPQDVRGWGFGVLATANGIGDMVSSAVVGALWSVLSPDAGFLYAGVLALIGAAVVFGWR